VRVRIKATPQQSEMDGVKLDQMKPGSVREVSSAIGSWLIVEGYADPEMRKPLDDDHPDRFEVRGVAEERRRKQRP
jgi:hypothetical protein